MPIPKPSTWPVLVLAPTGKDAQMVCALLDKSGIACETQSAAAEFCARVQDAAAAIVSEEALRGQFLARLKETLEQQPLWSDFPLIVLGTPHASSGVQLFEVLSPGANLTLVDRPVHPFTLITVTRAALRARERQYLTRDHLAEITAAREEISRQRDERGMLLESERIARAEAERVGRLKDEFLSTLSHELRTPLNAIAGWVHLLQHGQLDEEDKKKAIETIARNTQVQTELIEDLLDMSRIVSGKVQLTLEDVELATIAAHAVESVRPSADAKGVWIEVKIGEVPCGIRGDKTRLQQVVWNLVNNAVKFTPKGGRVEVSVGMCPRSAECGPGAYAEIRVRDTGMGIAPAFLPHVFDRFRQADASSTRRHGGLGLGLSIVKQLVSMHEGQVTATSEGEGKGATFTVTLPVSSVPARPQRTHSNGAAPATDLSGVRVLLIDDDPDGREVLRRMLESMHATVLTADSADAANRVLDTSPVDVLLSDIGMPGRDGYDLIRSVRAAERTSVRTLPAAALTAFARSEDRARAISAGYDSHISKPVDPRELLVVMGKLRAGRGAGAR